MVFSVPSTKKKKKLMGLKPSDWERESIKCPPQNVCRVQIFLENRNLSHGNVDQVIAGLTVVSCNKKR